MNKAIVLVLIIALSVSMLGCSGNSAPADTNTESSGSAPSEEAAVDQEVDQALVESEDENVEIGSMI